MKPGIWIHPLSDAVLTTTNRCVVSDFKIAIIGYAVVWRPQTLPHPIRDIRFAGISSANSQLSQMV